MIGKSKSDTKLLIKLVNAAARLQPDQLHSLYGGLCGNGAIESWGGSSYMRPTATSRTLSLSRKSVKSSHTRLTRPFASLPACRRASPLSSSRGITAVDGMLY